MHYHQGKYSPRNPKKYLGNLNQIRFRSGWELQMFIKMDTHDSVLQWGSEIIPIKFLNPIDGRQHTYFPDIFAVIKNRDGNIVKYLLEIKPSRETVIPTPTHDGRKQRRFLNESIKYAINNAKWRYAQDLCKTQGWVFKIISEKNIKFI